MNTPQISQIVEKSNTTALSNEQKIFKKLINRIDEQAIHLQDLQTAIALYQLTYFDTYLPLKKALDQYQIDFVFLLDSQYHRPIFSKLDQQKLTYLITNIAGELLLNNEASSQLKELFNCYSDVDYDKRYQQTNHDFKTMMQYMLDSGVNDFRSAPEIMTEREVKLQFDEDAAVGMPSADRLKECNQKLIKQLAELRVEAEQQELDFQLRFCVGVGNNGGNKFVPKKLVSDLLQEIVKVEKDIAEIKLNLQELADPKVIKAMLKNFRHPTLPMATFDIFDDAYFKFD